MKQILAIRFLCALFVLHLAVAHKIPSSLKEYRNPRMPDPSIQLETALLNARTPATGGGSSSGGGHPGTNNNGGNRQTGNKEDENEKKEDEKDTGHEESKDHKSEESETHAENESGKSEKPDKPAQELSPLNCSPSDSRVLARKTGSRATPTACAEKSQITTTATAARATTASPATTLLTAANGLSSANTKGSSNTGQTGVAGTVRLDFTVFAAVSLLSIVGMHIFGMGY